MSIMSVVQGTSGKISMMRVATFFIVFSVMGIFIAHNIVAMVHGLGFVGLGFQEASLIAAVLGAKAFQNFSEKKVPVVGGKPATTTDLPVDKKE